MTTLISDGIRLILVLEDWEIEFHMASWLPVALAMEHIPGVPRSIDCDDTNEEADTELCHSQTHDLVKVKVLGFSFLFMVWCLMSTPRVLHAFIGSQEPLFWWGLVLMQNLSSNNTGGSEWDVQVPYLQHFIWLMVWIINCQPFHSLNALVLRWPACKPTDGPW